MADDNVRQELLQSARKSMDTFSLDGLQYLMQDRKFASEEQRSDALKQLRDNLDGKVRLLTENSEGGSGILREAMTEDIRAGGIYGLAALTSSKMYNGDSQALDEQLLKVARSLHPNDEKSAQHLVSVLKSNPKNAMRQIRDEAEALGLSGEELEGFLSSATEAGRELTGDNDIYEFGGVAPQLQETPLLCIRLRIVCTSIPVWRNLCRRSDTQALLRTHSRIVQSWHSWLMSPLVPSLRACSLRLRNRFLLEKLLVPQISVQYALDLSSGQDGIS